MTERSSRSLRKSTVSRRDLIGLGALTACGWGLHDLAGAEVDPKGQGLQQQFARLEETWGGSYFVEVQRLDAPGHFELRPQTVLPTASTCKLFVLCELFRQAEAGMIDLKAPLTWKPEHHRSGDGVLRAMIAGQELSIHNLAILMIVLSDNIATAALVDLVGPDNINRSLRTWNLTGSNFYEGLPGGTRAKEMKQPVSTARDLCSLISRISRHEILTPKSCDEIIRILRAQRCNDMLPRFVPVGEDWGEAQNWIANKTGYGECRVEVGLIKSGPLLLALAMFFQPKKPPPNRVKCLADYPPVLAMAHGCKAVYDHFSE